MSKAIIPKRPGPKPKRGFRGLYYRNVLPPGKEHLLTIIDHVRRELTSDLAGREEDLTGAQRILIHEVCQNLLYQLVVSEQTAIDGMLDAGGTVKPMMNFYLSAGNSIQKALALLGIKGRDVKSPSLRDYLESKQSQPVSKGADSNGGNHVND
jgi:hypothetical protein